MPRTRPIGKTGGRQKGSLNLATKAIKEIAQPHTEEAISTLLRIMRDKKAPSQARVAACGMLLDRGWGRPHQSISADVQNENRFVVHMPSPMTHAEWAEYLKFKQRQIPIEQAKQQPKPAVIEAKPNGNQKSSIQ